MKNRTRKLLALIIVIAVLATTIAVLSGCNAKYENTRMEYKIEGEEVIIVGYTDTTLRHTLEVPDEIDGKPVTKIVDFSLCNAENLVTIAIGKNVREIGTWALTNNRGLKEFKVAEGNTHFTAVDGVLYTKDMKEIVAFPPLKGVELNAKMERTNPDDPVICVIPEGVEKIRDKAFYKCGYLAEVVIPSTVKEIGEKAFHRCSSLKKVALPEGLESIGKDAFAYCESGEFNAITIPASVKTIGEYAFYNCRSLKTINVGKSDSQRYALEKSAAWGKKWYPTDNGRNIKGIIYNYTVNDYVPGKEGLGVGAIIGIVIGCVAFVALVGVGVFFLLKKKKSRKTKANQAEETAEPEVAPFAEEGESAVETEGVDESAAEEISEEKAEE